MTLPHKLVCLLYSPTGRRVALVRSPQEPGQPDLIDAPSGELTEEERGWLSGVMEREWIRGRREGQAVLQTAASRVFAQVADVEIAADTWQVTAVLHGEQGTTVYCRAFDDIIDHIAQVTDNRVQVYGSSGLQNGTPRLNWLLPMLRERDLCWPLVIPVAP